MADASTPPPLRPEGRKYLPLILILLVLLIGYGVYRYSVKPGQPPADSEPTPVTSLETPTELPAAATAVPPSVSPTPACMPTGQLPPCENAVVEVGPEPDQLSKDPICLGNGNWVRWNAKTGSTGLKIFFPASGFPHDLGASVPPFLGMHRVTTGGKDQWEFNSVSLPVYSGMPNPAFGTPGNKYCIKYWQTINGKTADGRIIISR